MLTFRKIASSFVYSVGMAYLSYLLLPTEIASGRPGSTPWYIIIPTAIVFTIGDFVWSRSGKKARQAQ